MRLVMDPLGMVAEVVELESLKRWSQIPPIHHLTDYSAIGEERRHSTSPFPYNHAINEKIILWVGDISLLAVDAIVNSTNESMTERNPVSDRICARAGPAFREEIHREVRECRTGEVRVTQGHSLPARYVIHTVGPKYNLKYQTAAENTLHSCYRNVLQKACELSLSTVAVCVVNSVRRNFPPDEGAHIALRTVRRFLEQHGNAVETIVFAVENVDVGIYEVLLPLYFPRSIQEEETALWQLPSNVGGADGEPLVPDRQIRIIDNPQHSLDGDESVDLSSQLDSSVTVGEHEFSQMQGDLDQQRLLGERPQIDPIGDLMIKEMQNKERQRIMSLAHFTPEVEYNIQYAGRE